LGDDSSGNSWVLNLGADNGMRHRGHKQSTAIPLLYTGDVMAVLVDLNAKTLSYSVNEGEPVVVAWDIMEKNSTTVIHPAIRVSPGAHLELRLLKSDMHAYASPASNITSLGFTCLPQFSFARSLMVSQIHGGFTPLMAACKAASLNIVS
jgi:hypothetical protein